MNSGSAAQYRALDDAICQHLSSGSAKHPIYAELLLRLACEVLDIAADDGTDRAWRLIDRRLQALRKAGAISYVRSGEFGRGHWRACPPAATPPAHPKTEAQLEGSRCAT